MHYLARVNTNAGLVLYGIGGIIKAREFFEGCLLLHISKEYILKRIEETSGNGIAPWEMIDVKKVQKEKGEYSNLQPLNLEELTQKRAVSRKQIGKLVKNLSTRLSGDSKNGGLEGEELERRKNEVLGGIK